MRRITLQARGIIPLVFKGILLALVLCQLQVGKLESAAQFIILAGELCQKKSPRQQDASDHISAGRIPLVGVVLAQKAIDSANGEKTAAGDHHQVPQLSIVDFGAQAPDNGDLIVIKGLSGNVYRVMMQIFDGPAEPLSVDGLEGQGIADGVGTFVHTPPL